MGIFDIAGPIMIGPSSSHTAGAARIGLLARRILGERPVEAELTLYGSFAKTYKGHGTDRALIAGLLGYEADDARLRDAFSHARQEGLEFSFIQSEEEPVHPNTVRIAMRGVSGRSKEVLGVSIGGGRIEIREIDGFPVELNGEEHTLITLHRDQPGVIARTTAILSATEINISTMRVFRSAKHANAVMLISTDVPVADDILESIEAVPAIESVLALEPL